MFTAVNNISFDVEKGKTLAIVGESGSGKSLTALAMMGLLPVQAQVRGDIILHLGGNIELHELKESKWKNVRGNNISMVFQEPMSSLNPVVSVGKQIQEAIRQESCQQPTLGGRTACCSSPCSARCPRRTRTRR